MEIRCDKCKWCVDAQTQTGESVKACIYTGKATQVDPAHYCSYFAIGKPHHCTRCNSIIVPTQLSIVNVSDDKAELLCSSCYTKLTYEVETTATT